MIYVDAFAGEGYYEPKAASSDEDYSEFRELVKGSAAIALDVDDKPFDELIFIEPDPDRVRSLENMVAEHPDREIKIIQGDANVELPIFCENMRSSDRAVVFLDPFGPEVSWDTVAAIAETTKIDCWILFPLNRVIRDMPIAAEPPVGDVHRQVVVEQRHGRAEQRVDALQEGGREAGVVVQQPEVVDAARAVGRR